MSAEYSTSRNSSERSEFETSFTISPIHLSSVGPKGLARYAKWAGRSHDVVSNEAGIILFSALSPLQLEKEYQQIEAMAKHSQVLKTVDVSRSGSSSNQAQGI